MCAPPTNPVVSTTGRIGGDRLVRVCIVIKTVGCLSPYPPNVGVDTREIGRALPLLARRLLMLLPEAGKIDIRRVWRGIYSNTADGNPLVGWDKHNKV